MFLYFGWSHVAVDHDTGFTQGGEAPFLHRAGSHTAQLCRGATALRSDGRRGLASIQGGELLFRHATHVQMDVNAIEQRAGNALLIALHHAHRAGAFMPLIAVVATRTGIHGADQHKIGRKRQRTMDGRVLTMRSPSGWRSGSRLRKPNSGSPSNNSQQFPYLSATRLWHPLSKLDGCLCRVQPKPNEHGEDGAALPSET